MFSLARFHPLLPTLQQAKDDPTCFYSDHLPAMATFPLSKPASDGKSSTDAKAQLKVISWNILVPAQKESARSSGFAVDEDEKAIVTRAGKITQALVRIIEEGNPDAILLQEAFICADEKLCKPLTNELSKYGYALADAKDSRSTYTIYNTKRLTPIKSELAGPGHPLKHIGAPPLVSEFTITDTQQVLVINNVHADHRDLPLEAQGIIATSVKETAIKQQKIVTPISLEDKFVITAGDFNNRYVPLDIGKNRNIVTGAVPPTFRNGKQGADWTDGFFYRDAEGICRQPIMQILNPDTGKAYDHKESDDHKGMAWSAEQKDELVRQRPFLCADPSYDVNLEFVAELKTLGVTVGRSCNAFGDMQIALYLNTTDEHSDATLILNNCLQKIGSHFKYTPQGVPIPVWFLLEDMATKYLTPQTLATQTQQPHADNATVNSKLFLLNLATEFIVAEDKIGEVKKKFLILRDKLANELAAELAKTANEQARAKIAYIQQLIIKAAIAAACVIDKNYNDELLKDSKLKLAQEKSKDPNARDIAGIASLERLIKNLETIKKTSFDELERCARQSESGWKIFGKIILALIIAVVVALAFGTLGAVIGAAIGGAPGGAAGATAGFYEGSLTGWALGCALVAGIGFGAVGASISGYQFFKPTPITRAVNETVQGYRNSIKEPTDDTPLLST